MLAERMSDTQAPIAPSAVLLGSDASSNSFTGQVDEARIFTFSGFAVTELNYVPEPATWGLLASGAALGLAVWRNRRR